jgi:hypothetical protein
MQSKQSLLTTMFLVILFLLFSPRMSSAAPTNQNSAYLAWHSEPNTRGTWTIISNCLVTLTLCVYSAAHPNVPAPGSTYMGRLYSRAKWVVSGILVPEILVYEAWKQWKAARLVTRRIKELSLEVGVIRLVLKKQHSLQVSQGGRNTWPPASNLDYTS